MIPIYKLRDLSPTQILNRDIRQEADVSAAVDAVLADVRQNSDEALYRYTRQFDGAALDALEVTAEEIEAAWARLDEPFRQTLRQAAENIRAFHSRQVHQDFVLTDRPGVVMGQRYTAYSAFSDKSPLSRASAIADTILGRSTDSRYFSSSICFVPMPVLVQMANCSVYPYLQNLRQ